MGTLHQLLDTCEEHRLTGEACTINGCILVGPNRLYINLITRSKNGASYPPAPAVLPYIVRPITERGGPKCASPCESKRNSVPTHSMLGGEPSSKLNVSSTSLLPRSSSVRRSVTDFSLTATTRAMIDISQRSRSDSRGGAGAPLESWHQTRRLAAKGRCAS
jgi:hypothetical protein